MAIAKKKTAPATAEQVATKENVVRTDFLESKIVSVKGKMKNLLTNVEKEGLEHMLNGVNLSIYGDFWKEGGEAYSMGILPIYLSKDELRLDLADPYDYIKYKVLLACPIVANSLDQVRHRATNRFVLTSASEVMAKEISKVGNKVQAYSLNFTRS